MEVWKPASLRMTYMAWVFGKYPAGDFLKTGAMQRVGVLILPLPYGSSVISEPINYFHLIFLLIFLFLSAKSVQTTHLKTLDKLLGHFKSRTIKQRL